MPRCLGIQQTRNSSRSPGEAGYGPEAPLSSQRLPSSQRIRNYAEPVDRETFSMALSRQISASKEQIRQAAHVDPERLRNEQRMRETFNSEQNTTWPNGQFNTQDLMDLTSGRSNA